MADPGWMGQAGITSAGDLKFTDSDEITPGALKHEWFHLFQMEYHGMSSFEERGMMEWERALLANILVYIDLRGDLSTSTHSWACFEMGNNSYEIDYKEWLADITDDSASFPNAIDQSNFEHFADVFGDVSRSYNVNQGYNYSSSNYKPTAIQSLFLAAQNFCK